MQQQLTVERIERRLTTPRAAGVAGVLFALLFGASVTMVRLALPSVLSDSVAWTEQQVTFVSLVAQVAPFAGITFLWFLGVIRDRLGDLEDRFFASVFFGSGLLFVAMIFVSSALAASTISTLQLIPSAADGSATLLFGRALMYQMLNIYAMKMAGVFMLSLSTVWLRTGVMPLPVALVTLVIALVLMIVINFSLWIVLLFPAWVLSVSLYILYLNLRRPAGNLPNGMGPSNV
jgi:hypothetical protein